MHIYSQKNNLTGNATTSKESKHSASEALSPSLHVALVGASGYSGMELGRQLLRHPGVRSLTLVYNETPIDPQTWIPEARRYSINTLSLAQFKKSLTSSVQSRSTHSNINDASSPCSNTSADLSPSSSLEDAFEGAFDCIFLATPAEASLSLVPLLTSTSIRVIDLSGAFRLQQGQLYEEWYGFQHTHPSLLSTAHYGLVPFNNDQDPRTIQLVANPGCYATAVQMALTPLIKNSLLRTDTLVIDAKSGTTGAGKKASEAQLFAEVDEDCLPYRIGKHQHFPEIVQSLARWDKTNSLDPIFSTTLLPLRRGILASIYARLQPGVTVQQIQEAYQSCFEHYPLARITTSKNSDARSLLSLRSVVGSARTHITFSVDGTKLQIFSTIDNLMKGAASQAIENMNYLYQWPIETGLQNFEGLL